MRVTSPHLYRLEGRRRGLADSVLDAVLSEEQQLVHPDLPLILTLRHLAHLAECGYEALRNVIARRQDMYRTFSIAKRASGERRIAAPKGALLLVQRWINTNVLRVVRPHAAAFAYFPGSSVVACARRHLGAKWLVKLDVHDFFESISERQVFHTFRELGYSSLISFELARLTTRPVVPAGRWSSRRWSNKSEDLNKYVSIPHYRHEVIGYLPQGAPTSPGLSNLVSRTLDEQLTSISNEYRLEYTRYADDIVFSSMNSSFDRLQASALISDAEDVLVSNGFVPHRKKTTVVPPGARRLVHGLLVDGDRVRLTRKYKGRIDNHLRGVDVFGVGPHSRHRGFRTIWGFVRHVNGLLAHAHSVEADWATERMENFREFLTQQGWRHAEA